MSLLIWFGIVHSCDTLSDDVSKDMLMCVCLWKVPTFIRILGRVLL